MEKKRTNGQLLLPPSMDKLDIIANRQATDEENSKQMTPNWSEEEREYNADRLRGALGLALFAPNTPAVRGQWGPLVEINKAGMDVRSTSIARFLGLAGNSLVSSLVEVGESDSF
ncbi:uncharacterized [Tachysurus ichikawai]